MKIKLEYSDESCRYEKEELLLDDIKEEVRFDKAEGGGAYEGVTTLTVFVLKPVFLNQDGSKLKLETVDQNGQSYGKVVIDGWSYV